MSIAWNCDSCFLPIEDYKGYISISPYTAIRRMVEIGEWTPAASAAAPDVLPWRTLHEACETDPQGPEYWWDIQRLRTQAGVEEFSAHLRWKNWPLTATNLESFVNAALARYASLEVVK